MYYQEIPKMKKTIMFTDATCRIFTVAILVSLALPGLTAQDHLAGTITYQQVLRYSFENIEKAHGEDTQDWIAALPKEGITVQVLNFNSKKALFEEDESEKEATPPGLQRALMYESSLKPASPVVQKVHYDFDKNQRLEQLEYMTRFFLVQSEIEAVAWKLGSEKKKVLEYTCMNATVTLDDQEIVAWFSPEIPVSLGPSYFGGLPGLILAVERNGETAYVATSVKLSPPAEESIVKPNKGSKVTQEEFEAIQKEKEKERKENSSVETPHERR
jgi:GLPGLI family protein